MTSYISFVKNLTPIGADPTVELVMLHDYKHFINAKPIVGLT